MNTKEQGAIGVAKAIAYYGSKGFLVSIPIAEIKRYDLVVDDGVQLLKVEVKTTNSETNQVQLRTLGGNQSWNGVYKKLSADDCDRVYLVNLNNGVEREFFISELAGRTSIKLV